MKVRSLYDKVSRSLFFVTAFSSCILIPFSKEILVMLLGASYKPGNIILSIMFFYPIHQSIGQIAHTMLYAIGKTRTQSYVGLTFMFVSILSSYFLCHLTGLKHGG